MVVTTNTQLAKFSNHCNTYVVTLVGTTIVAHVAGPPGHRDRRKQLHPEASVAEEVCFAEAGSPASAAEPWDTQGDTNKHVMCMNQGRGPTSVTSNSDVLSSWDSTLDNRCAQNLQIFNGKSIPLRVC